MNIEKFSVDELRKELARRTSIHACVDLCHSYFCLKDHNEVCNYYSERQQIECWALPDHLEWSKETEKLLEHYGMDSTEMLQAFNELTGAFEAFSKLEPRTRQLFSDIVDIHF